MSRTIPFALALALISVCSWAVAAWAADDKVDVSGNWAFEVDIAGNQGTPSFSLKQDGEKLSGKYKGQFGEAEVKGTVKAKQVEFSFEIEGGGKVVYTGTIDGETMKGKCDYAGQAEGTWTAKKKAE